MTIVIKAGRRTLVNVTSAGEVESKLRGDPPTVQAIVAAILSVGMSIDQAQEAMEEIAELRQRKATAKEIAPTLVRIVSVASGGSEPPEYEVDLGDWMPEVDS